MNENEITVWTTFSRNNQINKISTLFVRSLCLQISISWISLFWLLFDVLSMDENVFELKLKSTLNSAEKMSLILSNIIF